MGTFFVGQRVRIVHSDHSPQVIGREARVIGSLEHVRNIYRGEEWDGYPIAVDGIGSRNQHGNRFCFPSGYLEPILPEGHTPSVYSYEELMDKCREGVVA